MFRPQQTTMLSLDASASLIPHHPRTLIADDEPDILAALRLLLKSEGYEPETVSSPGAVLEAIERSQFDVVLIDLNYARDTTSGREGIDLISRIQALDPILPIVVMTAWGTVDLAVEAMRRGVRDFVQKPWDNPKLLQTLRKQVKHARARRGVQDRIERNLRRETSLKSELAEARVLQENLLTTPPQVEGFDIAVKWQPARTVGGDYVAAFRMDGSHVALCVADVVGKGMPAALLMSNFQAALKSLAAKSISPAQINAGLNEQLYANTPLNKFITSFLGVLNLPARTITFTNAGHNPPLLMRADGEFVRLEVGGRVLAGFAEASFEEGKIELSEGDRLLLFTDGLTEAVDENGHQFGEERLIELLRHHRNRNSEELKEILFTAVESFSKQRFEDDAALMVVAVGVTAAENVRTGAQRHPTH